MAWSAVLTSQHFNQLKTGMNARWLGDTGNVPPETSADDPVMTAARQLTFDLPGVDWTIEVDILGRHRVTIHFKGAQISIDEG